jgi:uncharacterized damage-inducible protein DinB
MSQSSISPETGALLDALNAQRRHVLGILEDLSDADLRRPVLPSGWTCLGMVRHLALDVERFWFRRVTAGEDVEIATGDEAWQVGPDEPAEAVLAQYRQETDLASAIITATPLDSAATWWPTEIFPSMPAQNLRETILHVITETACHAGHLDAARELIDGRTWLVLT